MISIRTSTNRQETKMEIEKKHIIISNASLHGVEILITINLNGSIT